MLNLRLKAQTRSQKSKKGFTLTEIAIVLGIIGLILGAIWVAAAGVYNNQRINNANTAVMQITQGIRALYATSNSTGYGAATDITSAMIDANAVPSNMVSGATLIGPFPGGRTGIIATSDGNGFVVAMSGVTEANCIALLTAVGGTSRDPGLFTASAVANALPATSDATTTGTVLTTTVTPVIAAAAIAGAAHKQYGGCQTSPALSKVRFGFALK